MNKEKFDQLKEYISKKIKMDTNVSVEKITEVSSLYFNVLDLFSVEFNIYKNMKAELQKYYGDKYKFYSYNYNRPLKTKSEIDVHIESDDGYYDHVIKLNLQESIVRFLEEVITMLKGYTFTIKNIIEIKNNQLGG